MQRLYQDVIEAHLKDFDQIAFLSGPRQCGKTTIARHVASGYNGMYLNWDLVEDRATMLSSKFTRSISYKCSPFYS